MTWTVDVARLRIGLAAGDASQDAALEVAMDTALAIAEGYCDRKFMLADDVEDYRGPATPLVLVRRYPLVALTSVQELPPAVPVPEPVPSTWRMDQRRGIVYTAGVAPFPITPVGSVPLPSGWPPGGFTLLYRGGYAPDALPRDLEAALWMTFDNVWATTPGWGAAAGVSSTQGVRQFSIDGMSITYDVENAASSAGAAQASAWGLLPATAIGILSFHRADSAALGG